MSEKICEICRQPLGENQTSFCNVLMHKHCATEDARYHLMDSTADMTASAALASLCIDAKSAGNFHAVVHRHLMSVLYTGFIFGATFPQDVMLWARENSNRLEEIVDRQLRKRAGVH